MPRFASLIPVLLSAVVTTAAVIAQPVWDDAWLMLMLERAEDIRPYMRDRPLLGQMWQWMLQSGAFWQLSYVLHFAGWLAMGTVTAALWSITFPRLRSHAPIVGALAVAPVICQTQTLLVNTMLPFQIPVSLVFGAGLIALHRHLLASSTLSRRMAVFAAVIVVLLTTQVSEYAVAASLTVTVLILGMMLTRSSERARSVLTASALFCAACVGYIAYWLSADAQARQTVRPESLLGGSLLYRLETVPVKLANELWQLVVGQITASVSSLGVEPSYAGIAFFLLAIVAGTAMTWSVTRQHETPGLNFDDLDLQSAGVLVWALAAGLLPVVIMNRTGATGGMATRFWVPVLPVAACTAYMLALATLGRARRSGAILLVSFVVVYSTIDLVRQARESGQRATAWGKALRAELSPAGLNLAVFVSSDEALAGVEDYELTARLASEWSAEERSRFWALPRVNEILPSDSESTWGVFPPRTIDRSVRGLGPSGDVKRVILVAVDRNGKLRMKRHDVSDVH